MRATYRIVAGSETLTVHALSEHPWHVHEPSNPEAPTETHPHAMREKSDSHHTYVHRSGIVNTYVQIRDRHTKRQSLSLGTGFGDRFQAFWEAQGASRKDCGGERKTAVLQGSAPPSAVLRSCSDAPSLHGKEAGRGFESHRALECPANQLLLLPEQAGLIPSRVRRAPRRMTN